MAGFIGLCGFALGFLSDTVVDERFVGAGAIVLAIAIGFAGLSGLTIGRIGPNAGARAAGSAGITIIAYIFAVVVLVGNDTAGAAPQFGSAVRQFASFAGTFVIAGALSFALARGSPKIIYLAILVATMIALCIGFPAMIASAPGWSLAGPLLLFVVLLTLINAPFDWASLGLTRALLRRGLELGGWWPYVFALMDAALAAIIITLLAATMVVGVQAFDTVAVHRGGKPVLPLSELFDGVTNNPSAPEFWWLYALLISSMIPSMLNLAIGGVAFVRGVPGLRSVVLGFLPAGKAVPPFDRTWIALVLTAQTFLGMALGIAAQALLAIGIIGYVMPWLGLHILDVARDIADFNLPERVWALFVGWMS